jgi:membrane protein implicated in regulation of membrane protease activity
MEQIYYGVAVFVYSLFIVRFILSWIGGDFDVDMDVDTDLDLSDVVSFKGATHFLMGVSGWLSVKSLITHNVQWWDYLIAFAVGIAFVIILYFVYKLLTSLESKPQILNGRQLIGKDATIYLVVDSDNSDKRYIITVENNVGTIEVSAESANSYSVGEKVTIKDYRNAYYII